MRSLPAADDTQRPALNEAIDALAEHLVKFGAARLSDVVRDTLSGDPARVDQRFLELFTHGMGGLLDVPLYSDGKVDLAATGERDRLAEAAYRQAKASLGS